MNAIVTSGIVLTRTDFQEADRILTMLTPDQGKVRLIAKGVRKIKSKLAGGIELFGINQVSYIPGKKEIHTLISSRLEEHFSNIAKDIDRTMLGYDVLKLINRITEDNTEMEYFYLLRTLLQALDDQTISVDVIKLWMYMQLLKLTGHSPNLVTDTSQNPLSVDTDYVFSFDDMTFSPHIQGPYHSSHIKLLRLAIGVKTPGNLRKVQAMDGLLPACEQLAQTMLSQYVKTQTAQSR